MQDLIVRTLEHDFDLDRFSTFVKNLFNVIDLTPQELTLSGGFKEHIKSFKYLGEYNDAEKKRLDVLVVELKGGTKVAKARAFQRNLIARYLKDNLCDAALVAFYSADSSDWRLSFVKMDYQLTDKGAKVEVGTPPKRYSFLVGVTEPSHTSCSQLLPVLKEQKRNPLVSQVEDAFSIERVTKEFFIKYRTLFENLTKTLKKNHAFQNEAVKHHIDTVNFAKKLLGQIVFLYFLQKKGWLGVPKNGKWGEGDKHFLSNLFRACKKENKNFFNDYLEVLFYNTLNNPRNDQVDRNYSSRFKCNIPFLNGGLFEPEYDWQNSFVFLDNSIFEDILGVFDLYNFTVKEDEPLEKEVAVDPEMLGKVFENLIEENLRKGKGTYYTPREIVHYMCQESIANYIANETKMRIEDIKSLIHHVDGSEDLPKTIKNNGKLIDQSLAGIKIVDPACGSGAFCVGMLQEIVKARALLNPKLSEYQVKKEAIQNSIHGVDIDPGAIEIAKLRLWLSLVVDYEIQEIEPLPNLDYRVMQGNSLIELLSPELLAKTTDSERNELIDKLRKLKDKFFNTFDSSKRKRIKDNIHELIYELVNNEREKQKDNVWNKILAHRNQTALFEEEFAQKTFADIESQLIEQIKELDELKEVTAEDHFEWHLNFFEAFEKGGFDVVIANPPYIDSESMVKGDQKALRDEIQKTYSYTKGNWDIYIAFFEIGFNILQNQGVLTFITPDKWISKPFGNALRIGKIHNIFEILRSGRGVFESVNVDSIISFFSSKKKKRIQVFDFIDERFILKRDVQKDILSPPFALDSLFSDHLELLQKINQIGSKSLADMATCENACATSAAYLLKPLIEDWCNDCDNKKLKIVNTGTISKYSSRWGKSRMTYLKDKYLCPIVEEERFFDSFKNTYAAKAKKPKIIIKGLNLLDACIDLNGDTIPGKSTLIVTSDDKKTLKLLLAILNSKLAFFYLKEKYPASSYNKGTTFTKAMINEFPLPDITDAQKRDLINLSDKLVKLTSEDDYFNNKEKQANVEQLQDRVDKLIYKIYRLTNEEVSAIGGK